MSQSSGILGRGREEEREREKERDRDRQRERERKRDTERESHFLPNWILNPAAKGLGSGSCGPAGLRAGEGSKLWVLARFQDGA